MNKLIVSITSYPRRFDMLRRVLLSLRNQTYKDFDVLITVCNDECKNDMQELNRIIKTSKLSIHLNVVNENTYCHKNTFEAMKLFPNNPILVIDDDIIRVPTCIENFVKDYLDFNCIIARTYDHLYEDEKIKKTHGIIINHCIRQRYFTGKEMPNTGGQGILYPPNVFKDQRFYDANLIKECSPTSTEVWVYFWCLHDKIPMFFTWDKTWNYRLDLVQKDGCLYMVNDIETRQRYLENCIKKIGL